MVTLNKADMMVTLTATVNKADVMVILMVTVNKADVMVTLNGDCEQGRCYSDCGQGRQIEIK